MCYKFTDYFKNFLIIWNRTSKGEEKEKKIYDMEKIES